MTATIPAKVDLRLGDSSQPWDPEGSTTILKSSNRPMTPMIDWRGEIESLFPELTIISPVASGALSRVFEVVERATQEPFALKAVPFPQGVSSVRARLEREWRVLASLTHPNLVRGHQCRQSKNTFYLLMEFVSGMSLQQKVARYGPLPPRLAAKYIGEAACGLAAAHAAGVVHRDVKPSNLLLDKLGAIRVVDFGMALEANSNEASLTLLHEDTLLGTVDYMAPEQALSSHDVDARADIYSLGCTLHYLLTGQAPFAEGPAAVRLLKHRHDPPPDLRAIRPDVPPALAAMFQRMMAKDPDERYASMEYVRDVAEQTFVETPSVGDHDRHEIEQLVKCLSLSLERTSVDRPISPGVTVVLNQLRDRIGSFLERQSPPAAW